MWLTGDRDVAVAIGGAALIKFLGSDLAARTFWSMVPPAGQRYHSRPTIPGVSERSELELPAEEPLISRRAWRRSSWFNGALVRLARSTGCRSDR